MNLKWLYITAYGYKVLSALDMHTTTNLEGLENILSECASLGFNLSGAEQGQTNMVKMSDELKECIWWIAENRGTRWENIK